MNLDPRTHSLALACLVFLGASLAAAARLEAQVLYGSIVVNVTDPSGAGVPGADVVLTHKETNQSRATVTSDTGGFSFSTVRSGSYTLKVSLSGFKEFIKTDVPVTLNNVTRIDVTLEVGAVVETVTVEGVTPLLQTDRAEVRAEVTEEKLGNLPVPLGRNYQQLYKTVPGFTPPAEVHSIQTNPSRSLSFNVNGTSNQINNTRIDGATSADPYLPHITAYVPSLEAIQTVNVVTGTFDAEQGLAGGAAINVQLKSGTNEFHGALFEYHHNQHLRARNFFYPPDRDKGKFIFNQWGATLGGPIKRQKLFFFTSYEGTGDHRNASRIASVPTQAVRNGDFSRFDVTVYDPLTGNADASDRMAFPGNRIPENRKDAIAQRIIARLPAPNLPNPDGTFAESNNYFASAGSAFDRWTLDNKIDWTATRKLSLFGRFSVLDYSNLQPTVFGEALVGEALTAFGGGGGNAGTGSGNTYNFSVGANYVVTPRFLIDANLGFVRFITDSRPPAYGDNIGLDLLGIPGTNGPEIWQSGWPQFDVGGYSPWGSTEAFMPYVRRNDQYQYVANFMWTRGRHELRWGLDFYNQRMNHFAEPEPYAGGGGQSTGPRGRFIFGAGPTQLCEVPDGQGGCRRLSRSVAQVNSFASFLLGAPTTLGKTLVTIIPYTSRNWEYSFYIRDRWHVNPKLTLSYGLRWEYFPIPTRVDRGMERYDPDINKMLIGGVGVVPKDLGIEMSKKMFAPRAGLAYRLTDTFVLRAGYGITNDPYPLSRPLLHNHPNIVELALFGSNAWTPAGRLANGIPPVPVPSLGNGIIEIEPDVGAVTILPDFRRGYIQSWNLTLQKELKWNFVGEVGYVATRQIRQLGLGELNWAPVGTGRSGQQLFRKFGRTARARVITPIGGTHYDSLQARLERRFAAGFSLDTAYTWGKSITTSGQDNSDGTLRINIPEYYDLNRCLSGFDRTHNLQITHIVELPFGRGKRWLGSGGVLAAIAGGWQINGILSFHSGTPFSIGASGVALNAPESTQRADQVKPQVQILGGVGPGQPYFDPLAFAPVEEPRFGNAAFNSVRGPGVINWDFGLFRHFQINERIDIQFRMEAFNFTNTPHFGNPGANVSSMSLNPDGTVRSLGGFSEISSARDERQFRFGLRLGF
jgi:Carboxypeptidase regulatory-like domain/TonB dependent receptor-like, beta-barrel/TonB-dependent Receptor Plug Domain